MFAAPVDFSWLIGGVLLFGSLGGALGLLERFMSW